MSFLQNISSNTLQMGCWPSSRVYTSHLRMRFQHCVGSFMSMETNMVTLKSQRNAENACVNGMWQLGLRKLSFSKFDLFGSRSLVLSTYIFFSCSWHELRGQFHQHLRPTFTPADLRPLLLAYSVKRKSWA